MANYAPPLREIHFVINELLDYARLHSLPAFSEATPDLTEAVLSEAGKFAAEVFAPVNRIGDQQGVRVDGDTVITADGFVEAYRQYIDNGWSSLAQDPKYGGQGLPFLIHIAVSEMWHSACTSLALCPMLTASGIDAISAYASDELKARYLPGLISGKWTATMNLTEPHAGSDLSTLKTQAEPGEDHYLIRGQKIFITWGEHDMAENIVHLVLGRMVDAPPGNKGLSLFLVPKYLVKDDGTLGERNDLEVVSTEHKLGIHASPTCVMSFGEKRGAVGYLVGHAGEGLACMFAVMNHARLEVSLQGVGLAERAYQDALEYARERIQGYDAETGDAAAIIQHADVQRMLMQMKALTDAMRSLTYDGAWSNDLSINAETGAERSRQSARLALLTPLTKAWTTELVNEICSLAIQVHGGIGFIEETGVAQYFRDARIASIYEGTTGIQANDLVHRKLLADEGAAFGAYMDEFHEIVRTLNAADNDRLRALAEPLASATTDLQTAVHFILEQAGTNPKFPGAVAYHFLMMTGYIAGAFYLGRAAIQAVNHLACQSHDHDFYEKKMITIRFYYSQLLSRYKGHRDAIIHGAAIGVSLDAGSFQGATL